VSFIPIAGGTTVATEIFNRKAPTAIIADRFNLLIILLLLRIVRARKSRDLGRGIALKRS
jgi:hypothetical protein